MNTKFKAVLKLGTQTPDGKVTLCQNITNNIVANPTYFPTASLPLPVTSMTSCVNNLHNAILATASGAAGSISNMHEKERILTSVFNVVRAYVEMQANNTTDPQTVIQAAGMIASKSSGGASVSELTIAALGNGVLQISVPRQTGESAFIYYYSSDNGNTWQEFECSKYATVQLKNQTPASTLQFKYVAIGKTKGAFSQTKSAIVL